MVLSYDDLNKSIDSGLNSIYLLYGNEQYLIENAINRIKKKFRRKIIGNKLCFN